MDPESRDHRQGKAPLGQDQGLHQLKSGIRAYDASPALDASENVLFFHHETFLLLTLIPN